MKSFFISLAVVSVQIMMILTDGPYTYATFAKRVIHWDAKYYACIGDSGYQFAYPSLITTCQSNNVAFWPLFPIFGRYFSHWFRVPVQDALIGVGLLAALGFWFTLLRVLKRSDLTPLVQTAVVFFLFSYPTAFFMNLPYTEGLYLFFTTALACAFFSATESWLIYPLLFLLGLGLSLTRVQGVAMLASFGLIFILRFKDSLVRNRAVAAGLGIVSGLMGFFCVPPGKFRRVEDYFLYSKVRLWFDSKLFQTV